MNSNESVKKLENSRLDRLTIKRDALLKKKRLLDAVEKLRQDAPQNQTQFVTNCSFLVNVTKIQELTRLKDFLKSIEAKSAISVEIQDTLGGISWGSYKTTIRIGEQFDNYYENISKEYHELNKTLERSKENKWVYYTSLVWVITKTLSFIGRHKIPSSLITILLALLAYNYSVAWKNLNLLKDLVLSALGLR